MKTYVQYGAGNKFIPGWMSFDASPTLRIQRVPILGRLLRRRLNCHFEDGIIYGDIVKGLPLPNDSADFVFCSHVLEHLTLADFNCALKNTYKLLKPGGIFRVIVPDLQMDIEDYIRGINSEITELQQSASLNFCRDTCLGLEKSREGFQRRLIDAFSGSRHQWMWDSKSLPAALASQGFVDVHPFVKGDSEDEVLLRPESDHQFLRGIAFQCRKP
jgi:SAM-dependent methyltransferase